ncbi:MAG: sensor histidine kinase [Chloroflexota bacterium]|nr:sensor histidine kinase [Chloroflexota bacterium]MDQ5864384.1 sensor histidine kinase [Chloroflexota bacterium]
MSEDAVPKSKHLFAELVLQLEHARRLLQVSAANNLEDVASGILLALGDIIPFGKASLQLFEGDTRRILATSGYADNLADAYLLRPISQDGLIQEIFQRKETYVLTASDSHWAWPSLRTTSDMQSWIGIPLIYGDVPIGLVTLGHALDGFYTEEQLTLLELMAQYATSILHDAISFQQQQEQVVALTYARESLENALHFFDSYRNLALIGLVYGEDIHYAKNLLGMAAVHADRIAKGQFDDTNAIKRYARKIVESIQDYLRLLDITHNMAVQSPEHVQTNLHGMLDSILSSKRINPHIRIDRKYNANPSTAYAPPQLRQVFLVIIQNALDAMHRGEGVLTLMTNLENRSGAIFIRVSISDTGGGIPEKEQETLFTFNRHHDLSTPRRGSGMGLPWAYAFMKVYRGDIQFETSLGHGTTIHVLVPQDFRQVMPLQLQPEEISNILTYLGRVTQLHTPHKKPSDLTPR